MQKVIYVIVRDDLDWGLDYMNFFYSKEKAIEYMKKHYEDFYEIDKIEIEDAE